MKWVSFLGTYGCFKVEIPLKQEREVTQVQKKWIYGFGLSVGSHYNFSGGYKSVSYLGLESVLPKQVSHMLILNNWVKYL